MIGITNEMNEAMMHLDPTYRQGYEDGFKVAKHVMVEALKEAIKKVEKAEAYTTATSTVET